MAIAEELAFSLSEERSGIHVLLWDDKHALIRVLLVTRAVLRDRDLPQELFLISDDPPPADALRRSIMARISERVDGEWATDDQTSAPPPHPLWMLFLRQALSQQAGARLNGWRQVFAEPLGTLIVVRNADFDPFQRSAPDLASFVGPRIYDASRIMMICSRRTRDSLERSLPHSLHEILRELPGELPTLENLRTWEPLLDPDEG